MLHFALMNNINFCAIIIIIIVKQLMKQHMPVTKKLMNFSCGLVTAVSDRKDY